VGRGGLNWQQFERDSTLIDIMLPGLIEPTGAGALQWGTPVVVCAGVRGREADGVPDGTRGILEGVILLFGTERAAVRLDANCELVYVSIAAVQARS
jgi:hypothetical protein